MGEILGGYVESELGFGMSDLSFVWQSRVRMRECERGTGGRGLWAWGGTLYVECTRSVMMDMKGITETRTGRNCPIDLALSFFK